jgi:nucleoside-diphosphate-sugar epimerase
MEPGRAGARLAKHSLMGLWFGPIGGHIATGAVRETQFDLHLAAGDERRNHPHCEHVPFRMADGLDLNQLVFKPKAAHQCAVPEIQCLLDLRQIVGFGGRAVRLGGQETHLAQVQPVRVAPEPFHLQRPAVAGNVRIAHLPSVAVEFRKMILFETPAVRVRKGMPAPLRERAQWDRSLKGLGKPLQSRHVGRERKFPVAHRKRGFDIELVEDRLVSGHPAVPVDGCLSRRDGSKHRRNLKGPAHNGAGYKPAARKNHPWGAVHMPMAKHTFLFAERSGFVHSQRGGALAKPVPRPHGTARCGVARTDQWCSNWGMRVLIAGCGYVGLPLGAELARMGHQVCGLRRSRLAVEELGPAGIELLTGDMTREADLRALPGPFDWVVNTVSASGRGEGDYRAAYLESTRCLLQWLRSCPPRRFVYTSSTGVYGNDDGSLVTETDPTTPANATGQILVATEHLLLEAAREWQFPAVILRVAGIYGPGRGHWFKLFLRDEARLEGEGDRILNMIHRDDVAGCVIAALLSGRSGEIYNAVDDEPVTQAAFYQWLGAALGKGMPPLIPAAALPAGRPRGGNKRVSNRKLKAELNYRFRYPTFREGYAPEVARQRQAAAAGLARVLV